MFRVFESNLLEFEVCLELIRLFRQSLTCVSGV